MAVADVRERVVSAHALVARPQVDRGVTARPRVIVEVPVIDVEPDSAELVDELQEAVEVDGDEVVDRKTRERLHGLETSERTTLRERGVDPIVVDEPSRTVNRDDQIARERQHRDRVRSRIGPDEHQRVGPSGDVGLGTAALVGTDQKRGRRSARRRDVEMLLRQLVGFRLRRDRAEELVLLQIGRPRCAAGDDQRRHNRPTEDEPDDMPRASPRRIGLAVSGHRRPHTGREDRPAVAGRTAHSSLQRGLHAARKQARRPRSGRHPQPRIADRSVRLVPTRRPPRAARTQDSARATAPARRAPCPCARRSRRPGRARRGRPRSSAPSDARGRSR